MRGVDYEYLRRESVALSVSLWNGIFRNPKNSGRNFGNKARQDERLLQVTLLFFFSKAYQRVIARIATYITDLRSLRRRSLNCTCRFADDGRIIILSKYRVKSIFTRRKFHTEPNGYWHNPVMNHVQPRDLIILFPQHEEYSIKEFSELGEVVPPAATCHSHCHRTVWIVYRLTTERIIASPPGCQGLRRTNDTVRSFDRRGF